MPFEANRLMAGRNKGFCYQFVLFEKKELVDFMFLTLLFFNLNYQEALLAGVRIH